MTTIDNSAFRSNQISEVIIPSTVESVVTDAFRENQIANLDLSNATNLETIGARAFRENSPLTNLYIPSSLKTIGEWNFYGSKIAVLDLSNAVSLTTISDFAFYNNSIGSLDFSNCSMLQSIKQRAFASNKLESLILSDSVESIGEQAFFGTYNTFSSLYIPNSVTSMAAAFGSNLKSITVDKAEGEIEGAPWGATNATLI